MSVYQTFHTFVPINSDFMQIMELISNANCWIIEFKYSVSV